MPKKTSPEIKERAPNQDITTIIGLGDMINQQSEKILSVLKKNYLGSENAWVKVGAMSKEIVERARRLNDIESGNGELVERLKREISRLRKENDDLKNKVVSNVTNITNNTSDSSNEVRVDKAELEDLSELRADIKYIKQVAEWITEKQVDIRNKKAFGDYEDRVRLYKEVAGSKELFISTLVNVGYARSSAVKYFNEIKNDNVT